MKIVERERVNKNLGGEKEKNENKNQNVSIVGNSNRAVLDAVSSLAND